MRVESPQGSLSEENLNPILKAALANNFGIALYRLPHEETIRLVFGPSEFYFMDNLPDKEAFLLASFNYQNQLLAIEPTQVFTLEEETAESELAWHQREPQDEGLAKDDFKKLARYGIEQIKAGSFDKVVAANKKVVDLPEEFGPLSYFFNLVQHYPGAFISLTSTPQYGTWIGATPELLLSFDQQSIHTEALAGTKSPADEEGFTEKEEQEQALVSQYIEACFNALTIDYQKEGPQTTRAGKLSHIKTFYSAGLNGHDRDVWKSLLNKLHPTPAVCGYPYKITKIFIRNEEPFDRELYTGFLGPYHPDGKSELYVNLRCMELHPHKASIYAGAGIVKGSKSEDEWAETEEKMKTLETVFQG